MQEFVEENQLEQYEDTEIVVDENLNEIEDTLVEDEDSNIHEIIVDENAEQEYNEEESNNEENSNKKN